MREELVRTVFRLMGPIQDGHTHMFFKFQSSKFVTAVEKAWPSVKWIYLFRDPLEVMASNLKVYFVLPVFGFDKAWVLLCLPFPPTRLISLG